MSGTAWLVDHKRIASKIRSASAAYDPERVEWKSNPSRSCPNCEYVIDNSDVAQAWPGLPLGVKFDPSDQEIVCHLISKSGDENVKPHPFIDAFIPTVENDDGICYTHPQNLPGVKQDGSVSHFFHRAVKAYNTGTRKRRKIHGVDSGDVRWHKTGRTKPILLDGVQKGCKKIMVLYVSSVRGGKAEKTNWVMHQYHLGTEEDEKDGEYVLSKVFYQQQTKLIEKSEEDTSENVHLTTAKVDPITPKSVDPEPRPERRFSNYDPLLDSTFPSIEHQNEVIMEDELEVLSEHPNNLDQINVENLTDQVADDNSTEDAAEDNKWWEDELLMSSQQLVEGLSLCDDLLQSQSPSRGEQGHANKPCLADYARLGPEDLKRDLEECRNLPSDTENTIQNLPCDPENTNQNVHSDDLANIDLDTPPDFRLSQLEFESQDSYIAWGGTCQGGRVVLE